MQTNKNGSAKTGAQLNAELVAKGQDPIYDPKTPYNVFSTGDIKEVSGGINITNRLGENRENDLRKVALDTQNALIAANTSARSSLNTIATQRSFLMDENFESGFGQEFLTNMKKLLAVLGFQVKLMCRLLSNLWLYLVNRY